MKILHVNITYNRGSTGVIVEDLHNMSMKEGFDSYVTYSNTSLPEDKIVNGYQIGNVLGKKMHGLLSRIGGKQGYFSHLSTRKLIKHIDKVSPDIVHLHNLHGNFLHVNMLLDYLGKKNISTVVTLHDCWLFTGGCTHYTISKCDKWLDKCGGCPKNSSHTPAYIYDASASILRDRKKYFGKIKNLTVVGVSNWITSEANKTFFSKSNSVTIHNGIDNDFFCPTESDLKKQLNIEDKFVILGFAKKWLLEENKKAFETVTKGIPNDAVMVLFGCNESEKAQLPPNVIGMDFIRDRDTLRKLYSMGDVFANCTRQESLSLINVEVQSCGTPIVTYRNTGAKETVDNESSFSVEDGNAEEMLSRILEIKQNGKSKYSEQCRKFVREKFNRQENYEKYISLYRSIAENTSEVKE